MKNRNSKKKPKPVNTASRVVVVFTIMLIVVFIYLFRLLQLQVFSGDEIRAQAQAQRSGSQELLPTRGALLDRNRKPLALSVSVRSLYAHPQQIPEGQKERFSEITALVLGLEKSSVRAKLESNQDSVRIKEKLTDAEIEQMWTSGLAGFSILPEFSRYYPNGTVGAQIMGFLDDSGHGLYGLEAQYDDLLSGSPGRLTYAHDLAQDIIPTADLEEVPPTPGLDVVTTLDLYIQESISEVLQEQMEDFSPEFITAIVVDPSNGEILGMDSLPSYNANNPRELLGEGVIPTQGQAAQQLEKVERLWMNPNVSWLYEPGSVFKTLTTAISLETQSTKPGEHYECTGSIEVAPGESIKCWDWTHPHGQQTLEEAFNHSCNPAYVQLVREIGREKFYSYLESLHVGGISGVDMPAETQSLAPKSAEEIGSAELATMSYGHGIAMTPLQMISAVNATINGGYYYPPHLYAYASGDNQQPVKAYKQPEAQKIFSDATVKEMRNYLHSAAVYYKAPMLQLKGQSFGGKSGTSYIATDGGYSEEAIASYWAFYPLENPKYACLVVCDRAKHGNLGGVVGMQTVSKIFERMVNRPEESEEDTAPGASLRAPDFTGLTAGECRKKAADLGLELSLKGDMSDFDVCGWQKPEVGRQIQTGDKIQIGPDGDHSFKVPDFKGMTEEEARRLVENSSIQLSFEGQGRVSYQSPRAGSLAPGKQAIALSLKEDQGSLAPAGSEASSEASSEAENSAGTQGSPPANTRPAGAQTDEGASSSQASQAGGDKAGSQARSESTSPDKGKKKGKGPAEGSEAEKD